LKIEEKKRARDRKKEREVENLHRTQLPGPDAALSINDCGGRLSREIHFRSLERLVERSRSHFLFWELPMLFGPWLRESVFFSNLNVTNDCEKWARKRKREKRGDFMSEL